MRIRFYEKYAWIIFLIIGAFVLTGAIPHMLGINTDPALVEIISGHSINELKTINPGFFNLYDFYFRSGGLSDLGFSLLLISIAVTAYRRGEKWSWYAFLIIPIWFFCWILISLSLPDESKKLLFPPLIVLILLSLLGLLLPIRIFFKQPEVESEI